MLFILFVESPVKAVALCAGSGASILQDTESDLYVTGKNLLETGF